MRSAHLGRVDELAAGDLQHALEQGAGLGVISRSPTAWATVSGSSSRFARDAFDGEGAAEHVREQRSRSATDRCAMRERMKSRPSGKARVRRAPSRAIGRHSAQQGLDDGTGPFDHLRPVSAEVGDVIAAGGTPTAGRRELAPDSVGGAGRCDAGGGRRAPRRRGALGRARGCGRAAAGPDDVDAATGAGAIEADSTARSSSRRRARPSRAPTPAASARRGGSTPGGGRRPDRGGGEQPAACLGLGLRGHLRQVATAIGQGGDAIERGGDIGGLRRRRPAGRSHRHRPAHRLADIGHRSAARGRRRGPGPAATRRRACRHRRGGRRGPARRRRPGRHPRRHRCGRACR